MRIISRYLSSVVVSAVLLVSLTLLGIESFMEFINELPDIGKQDYGVFTATLYVLMQLPSDFYQLFPIAGFLGSLLGIGRLANNSELIVMRAAGISVPRITWVVAKTALVMLLVVALIGEWAAPNLQFQATQMKLIAMHKQANEDQKELWIRRGYAYLHIEHVISPKKVSDVMSYQFDKEGRLLTATSARYASYDQGHWQLQDVNISTLGADQVTSQHYAHHELGFNFKPTLLQQLNRDTDQETLWGLWRNIQSRHQAGLIATSYEFNFWQRLFQPLTTLVMICLGVPFIFGSLRQVSTSARVLIGITIGFSFYMLNRFIGPLTLVYQWPPWLVAALPTVLFMVICIYLLRRSR